MTSAQITSKHIENAHADRKPQGVLIRKDRHISKNKIDAVMSSALAHEAAYDAKADGWGGNRRGRLDSNQRSSQRLLKREERGFRWFSPRPL
jgi:hypothetical protein